MSLINPDIDAFLVLCVVISLPWAYYTYRSLLGPRTPPMSAAQANGPWTIRTFLPSIIALHTLYILFKIIVNSPNNIFNLLHATITTPTDSLRAQLLARSDASELPAHLDSLLAKFNSLELRLLYVRFGHHAFQECEHCTRFSQFALYALPQPGLQYTREAIVACVLTIRGSGREKWRSWSFSLLLIAALLEMYWTLTINLQVSNDGTGVVMWHDRAWRLRQVLFLMLPVALHFAPISQPRITPIDSLKQSVQAFEQALTRVHFLKYSRGAVMRSDTLSSNSREWWKREKQEGEWSREDDEVRRMARDLGLGFDEADPAPLRETATRVSRSLAEQACRGL